MGKNKETNLIDQQLSSYATTYNLRRDRLLKFFGSRVRNEGISAELSDQVIFKILKHYGEDALVHEPALLGRVASNLFKNWLRDGGVGRKDSHVCVDPINFDIDVNVQCSPEEVVIIDERNRILCEEVSRLSYKQREVVIARSSGLSEKETAAKLNCSRRSINSAYYRSREMLRKRLSARSDFEYEV